MEILLKFNATSCKGYNPKRFNLASIIFKNSYKTATIPLAYRKQFVSFPLAKLVFNQKHRHKWAEHGNIIKIQRNKL